MAGILSGFLGGGDIPSFNTAPLKQEVTASTKRQQDIINGLSGQLSPLSGQYGANLNKAGANFASQSGQAATNYSAGLTSLGNEDKMSRDLAVANESARQARAIPEQQQSIRESLAATGGMRTGSAATRLAAPQMQMAQNISDLSSKLEQQGLDRQSARKEAGLQTLYSSQQGVALQQLGIDKDTATTLLNTGRADILQRAGALVGIEQNDLRMMLGIDIAGQTSDIAAAQAATDKQAAILSGLGSLAGAGIGSTYGPGGAAAGSQYGETFGKVLAGLS